MNATLNISADSAKFASSAPTDVALVAAETMAAEGFSAVVTPTFSAVGGALEFGASVLLLDVTPGQVRHAFRSLRDRLNLGCAWLETDSYAGCVLAWAGWIPTELDQEALSRKALAAREPFPVDPGSPSGPGRSEMVRRSYAG